LDLINNTSGQFDSFKNISQINLMFLEREKGIMKKVLVWNF